MSDADLPREPVRRVDEPAPFVPHQALPEHPAPTPGSDGPPSVSLEMIQDHEALAAFIASADRVMEAMGYTEHGFRHANLVASISFQVLHRLGYGEREATLASVAGYLHDVGNALARDAHGQTGAVLVYQALHDTREPGRPDADHGRDREPRGDRGDRRLAGVGRGDPGGQVRRASQPGPQERARSITTSTTA